MDKLLITGISGFVGRHFLDYLYKNKDKVQIYGIDIRVPDYDYTIYEKYLDIHFMKIDLLDIGELRNLFMEFTPNYILHLASFSSVSFSWQHPAESFVNNTNIFLNLITVVKEFNKHCRILSVGSSEEYGNVTEDMLPLSEDMPLVPNSPYAVARVSQELLSKVFVESYHLDIIMTRSFNHIGPWQDTRFVIPSFIDRIKKIYVSGEGEGTIETGDISVVRDFVDVRDVVRAYYLLLKKGKSGEIYNICSGNGVSLREIIDRIAQEYNIKVHTKINPEYVRPNDNMIMIGNTLKIIEQIGWKREWTLEETLKDMIKL